MSSKEKLKSLVKDLSEQVQAQEPMLNALQQQLEQQQESFNRILQKLEAQETLLTKLQEQSENWNQRVDSLPPNFPPLPVRDPFPITELVKKLDVDKLLKIVMYVSELYSDEEDES